jgi:hypothetical protein
MMRDLGGAVGIAALQTLLTKRERSAFLHRHNWTASCCATGMPSGHSSSRAHPYGFAVFPKSDHVLSDPDANLPSRVSTKRAFDRRARLPFDPEFCEGQQH